MHYRRLLIYTLCLFFFTSCTKELDQVPETQIQADNYYTTEQNVESTVTAAYNSLQELYDYYMILLGEIPSDNAYVQAPNSNTGVSPLEDFTWTGTTGFVGSVWENSYEGIAYTNTVLNVIEKINYKSQSVKDTRIGEMKFIRGFLYDNLTAIYGDVPLILKVDDPTYAFDDTRTPKAQVFEQIEKDLLEAITLLQGTSSPSRANEYAARAVLAKHYMRRQDFAKAELQLEKIVSSQKYSVENVAIDKLYGVANEGNKEDIFSIQYTSNLNGKSEGSSYYYNFTQPDNSGGKGAMAIESTLYNLYEANDLRKNLITKTGSAYYLKKWDPSPSSSTNDGGSNWYVVRYADVVLLYAECLNENNKTNEAEDFLNVVRKRAGLGNSTAAGQQDIRQAIELERRLELVGEGHRWFDLLRTNKALQTMNTFFSSQGRNIKVESKRLLAPIPQAEVNITKMVQNDGY